MKEKSKKNRCGVLSIESLCMPAERSPRHRSGSPPQRRPPPPPPLAVGICAQSQKLRSLNPNPLTFPSLAATESSTFHLTSPPLAHCASLDLQPTGNQVPRLPQEESGIRGLDFTLIQSRFSPLNVYFSLNPNSSHLF